MSGASFPYALRAVLTGSAALALLPRVADLGHVVPDVEDGHFPALGAVPHPALRGDEPARAQHVAHLSDRAIAHPEVTSRARRALVDPP